MCSRSDIAFPLSLTGCSIKGIVPTDRLYYSDSYLREFAAKVIGSDHEGTRVYLDRTAFYPTSGGQPHDLGALNQANILDVIDEGERISHILDRPLSADHVTGVIDWQRRYDHMQQHTGQHLLSAVIQEMLKAPTLSFHLGGEVSTIDLGIRDLTEAQISAVESRVNEVARESSSVGISFEDAANVEGLRKPSERAGTLRIISLPGWDRSACGGTHVRSLAEVLPIQLRRVEKMRGNVRLEFACGDRAIRTARQDLQTLSQLARLAGASAETTVAYFTALRQRLTDADKERQRLEKQLADREGRELYATTPPAKDGIRRICQRLARIDESQRAKANAFIAQPQAAMLLLSPEGVLLAFSADSGFNAAAILKQTVAACGGSGGGSSHLAQGKLTGPAGEQSLAEAGGFSLPPSE